MNGIDDDDDFLYGGPSGEPSVAAPMEPEKKQPEAAQNDTVDNGDEEEDMDEEDSEEDIEIITDAPVQASTNLVDYRSRPGGTQSRIPNSSGPSSALTTEYKPLQREEAVKKTTAPPVAPQVPITPPASALSPAASKPSAPSATTNAPPNEPEEPQVDPATLPAVRAPASASKIEPDKDGLLDGRSIYDVDIASLEKKDWRRPGSDLSDWFNYGFDEISWEAYLVRRRDLGEMANILKANVLSFSGMSEEQVLNMPGDLRGMVMSSAHVASMNAGNPNMLPNAPVGGATGPGGMHPEMMMNMGMMGSMGGGSGMGGDVNTAGQGMMMSGISGDGDAANTMGAGAGGHNMMQGMEYPSGMGMDFMGGETNNLTSGGGQFGVDIPTGPAAMMQGGAAMNMPPNVARGTAFRGRGIAPPTGPTAPTAPRGRGAVPAFRGRGRGFDTAPPTGPRAASPLPPNVPTGPRNQHRYKDRDTGAPGGENLDYGGESGGYGGVKSEKPLRDEFGRDIDRPRDRDRDRDDDGGSRSGRKRRGSPPEDSRGSKRR